MKKQILVILSGILLTCLAGFGQTITYSEPDKDDSRTLNFEVIGKVGGNVMIYKNYQNLHQIVTLGADMKQVDKIKLDFINFRLLNSEFIQYSDFVYMFYQYQKRSTLYCMVVKLDASGKKMGEPTHLDSTDNINYSANNKIYSILRSEDKQKILLFKVNTQNDKSNLLSSFLYDKDMVLQKKSKVSINMPQRNDFLSEFSLDNAGNLICIRVSGTSTNDNINRISLITKPALSDNFTITDLKLANIYLDDIRIKVDNFNNHYIISSFYSKLKRGNIEGLYYSLWDKQLNKELLNATTPFTEEFREEARGDGNTKSAFNDCFLKNIILRKDGGFIVIAESAYTSSRGNTLNRWDYLYGSPYLVPTDYYSWNSPIGYYPWGQSSMYNSNNNLTRYFADNVSLISFGPEGKMEWSNVIRKTQFDDNTDNYIGFGLFNTGEELHFIFNLQEKRSMILTNQTITRSGQINRNATLKNLDKGYDFMSRHSKQIGVRQAIVPCMYRGFTCFAKIDF